MANLRKCAYKKCGKRRKPEEMVIIGIRAFCIEGDHAYKHSLKIMPAYKAKVEKEVRIQNKKRKQDSMPRSYWYARLQKLVNQWVTKVRDKDEPCCTCGTTNDIKYDAGHYLHGAANPEIRFELTNIHKQCSQICNVHGSGKRSEYKEFLIGRYGQEKLDWLEGPHRSLKEQFPHIDDIKAEMDKYRNLLRDNGLRPVE